MSANDIQVGGSHYQVGKLPQHWDLAIWYRWDPFQYQITKYVMRWKYKHATPEERLTDLKKARHFLDKYIENAEEYDSPAAEAEEWQCEGYYGDMTQLYRHRKSRALYRAASLQQASEMHSDALSGAHPGRGYVAQG